jgi:hypothetical protein
MARGEVGFALGDMARGEVGFALGDMARGEVGFALGDMTGEVGFALGEPKSTDMAREGGALSDMAFGELPVTA